MKKYIYITLLVIFTLFFLVFPFWLPANACSIKCVDGDTFAIGKTYYRLADIDTPEKGQKNYKEASKFTCDWLKNNPAILEIKGLDKYGRTLVTAWKLQRSYTLATPGVNLNEILIEKCLAKPFYGKTNKTILSLYNNCK